MKTVLITGCSSGFGFLTAKKFQKQGWNVIATMRSMNTISELNELDNLWVLKLDVTIVKDINDVLEKVIKKFKVIDVLINNAGHGSVGLFEQHPISSIRDLFEVNVFGVMNMIHKVAPHMRKQKQGTIINITSIRGIVGCPNMTAYSSSKFAIEGFSESLALELKPFNIDVKTIAPGSFATKFNLNKFSFFEKGDIELIEYSRKIENHLNLVRLQRNLEDLKTNPNNVADKIYSCATTKTPIHNIIGSDVEMMVNMKSSFTQEKFFYLIEKLLIPTN